MSTDHPTRIGSYDVLGKIGKGGMGSVYKAVQPSLNRIVAIKLLADEFGKDETSVERFKREAKAVALVNHPNVVHIIEMDETADEPYFVMEYVQGTSLDAVMQRRRLSLTEALGVFKEVCKGLQAAHRQNIIHRDLNPRNVLVSEDLSVVKLADFGISRVEAITRAEGTLSTGNIAMGTLHYMAPEVSTGLESVDHRADIYALGVLLYEMLTGRVPVGRFSLPSQLDASVPPEVDPLVLRCLSAEPEDRFPTVDRVLEALTKIEDQLRLSFAQDFKGLSRSTSKLFSRSTTGLRRRPLLLGVGLVAALVLAGLSFAFTRGRGAPGSPAPVAPVATPVAGSGDEAGLGPDPQAATQGLQPPGSAPVRVIEVTERFRAPVQVTLDARLANVRIPDEDEPSSPPAAVTPAPPSAAIAAPPAVGAPAAETVAAAAPAALPAAAAKLEAAQRKAEAGLTDQALTDLGELIGEAEPAVAAAALLERSNVLARLGRDEDAMADLIELNARYPRAAVAAQGQYELGLLFRKAGKSRFSDALGAFSAVVDSYPGSTYVAAALARRAEVEQDLKLTTQDPMLGRRVPAALVSLRSLVERFPKDRAAERGAWDLAGMYRDLDLWAEAAAAYVRLGESFPGTTLDAWWEAGQLLEDKLDDVAGAIAAYEKVPEGTRSHSKAQRRLRKLSG